MKPLVWLPFDPSHLDGAPSGLRYEVVRPEGDWSAPVSVDEVELYVPPYNTKRPALDVIARMPRLRVIQTLNAGIDNIRPYVPQGVLLCNGRGIHDTSTAELALTLILASLRGVPESVRAQDLGMWVPERWQALADKRVLIVGHGQIGAAIEARLVPFEVEVVRVARAARAGVHAIEELPELLPEADVVVLIVPGTAETRGMVDAGFLARMKDGALLVNMARGTVVETDALLAALHTGRIHAALDVTDPEPLPPEHPLWRAPNLLITPHLGGASSAMWPRAHRLVREQLERFAAGEPLVNVMTGDY